MEDVVRGEQVGGQRDDDVLEKAPDPEDEVASSGVGGEVGFAKERLLGSTGLPMFVIGGYMRDMVTGLRTKNERREEKQRAEGKKIKEYRAERERKTAMFVTPGLPPLAMPPIVESSYWDLQIKSDARFRRLFPNDVERRARMKDLDGELVALGFYNHWLDLQLSDEASTRHEFYVDLREEMSRVYWEVWDEWATLRVEATPLGRFEFYQLDEDGGTVGMIANLEDGHLFNYEDNEEVQAHYGPLLRKYPKLGRFEKAYLETLVTEELVRKHWDKDSLEEYLQLYGDETWRKYSHLLDLFDEPTYSEMEASKDGSQDTSDEKGSGLEDELEQLLDDGDKSSASERIRN